MPRISNRRYPSKKCKNSACSTREFVPHDRRQAYCCVQCRVDANNDKRHKENLSRFLGEKQARINNRILKELWERLNGQKERLVELSILKWEKFKFESLVFIQLNSKTKRNILWYHDYGLELIDPQKSIYEIHKKV